MAETDDNVLAARRRIEKILETGRAATQAFVRECSRLSQRRGMNMDRIGRIGYEAYAKSTGGKTYDGRDMPKWDDLPDRIKDAWDAVARAYLR